MSQENTYTVAMRVDVKKGVSNLENVLARAHLMTSLFPREARNILVNQARLLAAPTKFEDFVVISVSNLPSMEAITMAFVEASKQLKTKAALYGVHGDSITSKLL